MLSGSNKINLSGLGTNNSIVAFKESDMEEIAKIIPELNHCKGLEQSTVYHNYDVWTHIRLCVNFVPNDLALKFAALFHDIGKGLPGIRGHNKQGQPNDVGHGIKGAEIAKAVLGDKKRFNFSKDFNEEVEWLVFNHMMLTDHFNKKSQLRWLKRQEPFFQSHPKLDIYSLCQKISELHRADMLATGKMTPEWWDDIDTKINDFLKVVERYIKDRKKINDNE